MTSRQLAAADELEEGRHSAPDGSPRPLYFGPHGAESFGWLHGLHDGAPASPLGVVLCGTLGRKEVCSHRLVRHLALDLAAAGIPVLRFDYPGTGDASTPSLGRADNDMAEGDIAHPAAWLASIGQAIDTLKQACGTRQVCVIGVDAGAMLACEAVQGRADVAAFVAMAPATKGRAWLREQRAFGMRAAQASTSTTGHLESGSHAFSPQALAELGRMDLQAIATAPAPDVLVLERDDQPGRASAWVEHLRGLGAEVECRPLAGYEALMAPPYQSVLPAAAIRETVDWVRGRAARDDLQRDASAQPRGAVGQDVLSLRAGHAAGPLVTERPFVVDPHTGLQGILTLPQRQAGLPPVTRAVVLLPAGADRRIGPGRIFVSLARQLAARGIAVLRLDISGIGDSPARPGCDNDVVYAPQALQDVDAVVRYAHDVLRIPHVSLLGYCSSSYNALKAAVAQTPVQALVLINQLVFFWKPGMSLDSTTSEAVVAFAARNYLRRFLQASRWRDVLRNPRKIAYMAQVLVRRPATLTQHVLRDVARRLGLPLKDDLGRELRDLAHRKVTLDFVFASGDPGEALLRSSGGSVVKRLTRTGALQVAHIEGADHEFTQLEHRLELEQVLLGVLAAPPVPAPASTPANAREARDALSPAPLQEH